MRSKSRLALSFVLIAASLPLAADAQEVAPLEDLSQTPPPPPGPYDADPAYGDQPVYESGDVADPYAADEDGDGVPDAEQSGWYDDGADETAYLDFQDTLSPYGSWSQVSGYGMVWIPSATYVGVDFSPYATNGHWELTEYGWTWVSDWDWGWAPFHYGRWLNLASFGWCWMPGRVWGPAWVSWRWGGGYVGWSPLGPRGHRHRFAGSGHYRYTRAADFGAGRPVFVPAPQAPEIHKRTSPIRNVQRLDGFRVEAGPDPRLIARVSQRSLTPARVATLQQAAPRPRIVSQPALPSRAIPSTRFAPSQPSPGWVAPRSPRTLGGDGPPPIYRSLPPAQVGPRGPAPGDGAGFGAPPTRQPPPQWNPSPVYRAPAPSPTPSPVYRAQPPQGRPAPIYQPPQPAQHAPVYRSPAPVYRAPTPQYQQPAPSYRAPAPQYQPAPSYRAPAPQYQAPPAYRAPAAAPAYRPSAPFAPAPRPSMPAAPMRMAPGRR